MPDSTVFLVRHGLTDWNEQGRVLGRGDTPLNDRGRQQAAAVADALRSFPIRRVLASPQRRVQETAAMIAAMHAIDIETDERLAEVWVRSWQGKTFAELRDDPDMRAYFHDATHETDAIESARAVQERVAPVFAEVAAEGATVLVSHGDPLRLLLARLLGMGLGEYRRLHVGPGSVSIVQTRGRRQQVVALNWQPAGVASMIPR